MPSNVGFETETKLMIGPPFSQIHFLPHIYGLQLFNYSFYQLYQNLLKISYLAK